MTSWKALDADALQEARAEIDRLKRELDAEREITRKLRHDITERDQRANRLAELVQELEDRRA